MAQNITLLGASYSDVPSVLLPKTGGGQAQFDDTTDATATASTILDGYTAYVNGAKITGIATGGGTEAGTVYQDANGYIVLDDDAPTQPTLITKSITANGTYNASSDNADGYSSVTVNVSGSGGLVYETGTLTPTADIADVTIGFANAHTTAPIFAMLCDTSTDDVAENSNFFSAVVNNYGYMGFPYTKGNIYRYGTNVYTYATSTALTGSTTNLTGTSSINTYMSSSGFRAYSGSSSRYWRAGRTYKWIAVWAPTS